ncbi:MAG: DNA-binding NtrC family response regulator [Alphaproteobacteria bacterium]|jgi:DNA-binding NtrC family response regulator
MTSKTRILIIDDDEDILIAGKLLLRRNGFDVVTSHQPEQIPALIKSTSFQVIMLDMNFGPGESSGDEGLKWLSVIRSLDPDCIVVMITAHGGMNLAIEAMKLGATDFVIKPWQNEKLVATVRTAAELSLVRNEAKHLRSANQLLTQVANQSSRPNIQSNSPAINAVMSLVARSAPTDANVLVLGENGTGKELLAKEIHFQSLRCNNIFLTVDLGAISETLFESELFGHKKGAFTGANEERIGKLEAANGGTLFLDELGNLPLHLQARLLTVLEQRRVTPLGANISRPFDVRVICATNVPKQTLLDETQFRQDLLFRLNTVEITLPALRDRPEDIAPLADYFVNYYCKKYNKPTASISAEVRNAMQHHNWPGNIRALRHTIERAIILSETEHLNVDDLQLPQVLANPLGNEIHAAAIPTTAAPSENAQTTVNIHMEDTEFLSQQNSELNLEKIEKQTITRALRTYRYNISHTAKALGLTRAALYRRMEKHGL